MTWNRIYQFALRFLVMALSILLLRKLLAVVIPWFIPFLFALLLAYLIEYPVRFLVRRLRLPRWIAAMVCTALLAALLASISLLAVRRVYRELSGLAVQLPSLIAKLPVSDGRLERWLYRVTMAAPAQYQSFLSQLPQRLTQLLSSLPSLLSERTLSLAASFVSSLPFVMLFSFTVILSTYFISASLPDFLPALTRLLPHRWHSVLSAGKAETLRLLTGWLKAQFTLLSVTFACLTIGLFILRIDLALLPAALITLVDALPILGSGTVLVPWALLCLLTGEPVRGFGLLVLYGTVSMLRSLLEPKLLGKHMGLPPLAALAALYIGFTVCGVAGLLVAPPAAVLLFGLYQSLMTSRKKDGDN